MAGLILENKFARYRADARADEKIDQVLAMQETQGGDARILVLPEFVPCQKRLKETDIAFVIFRQIVADIVSSHRRNRIP